MPALGLRRQKPLQGCLSVFSLSALQAEETHSWLHATVRAFSPRFLHLAVGNVQSLDERVRASVVSRR